jgi:Zn-dependent peptidase ImmA (M78 family)/DNA-binding XRE family transcriptional regulator
MTGLRIKQLRLAAGLTLDELVERLIDTGVSITKQALSNYENGKRIPKPTIVMALGRVFQIKPASVLSEPAIRIEWLSYRCKTALRVKDKQEIQAKAESHAERYMHLQNLLFPGEFPDMPTSDVSSLDDAERAAEMLREFWKLGTDPIDSVTRIIESNGGLVVEVPHENTKFDGLSAFVDDQFPMIAINTNVPTDRVRFNLAHELGHLVMKCDGVKAKFEEKLAHRFAAAFLAPAQVVYHEVGEMRHSFGFPEIGLLKQKYGLSMAAWLYRLHDLGIINEHTKNTAFIEFSRNGWRKVEPYDYAGSESPIRFEQMVRRALSEGVITAVKAEELRPGIADESRTTEERAIEEKYLKPSDIMKLPYSERRKILAELARIAEKHYKEDDDLKVFDAYGEDDLDD